MLLGNVIWEKDMGGGGGSGDDSGSGGSTRGESLVTKNG